MNEIGWSAMEVPILSIVAVSDGSSFIAKPPAIQLPIAKGYENKELFDLLEHYWGEDQWHGNAKVAYFDEETRKQYKMSCNEKGQLINANGQVFSSMPNNASLGAWLPDGEIYLSKYFRTADGVIQHSSFSAGASIFSAFELLVDSNGKAKILTDGSGHYHPSRASVLAVIEKLKAMGCDVSGFVFMSHR